MVALAARAQQFVPSPCAADGVCVCVRYRLKSVIRAGGGSGDMVLYVRIAHGESIDAVHARTGCETRTLVALSLGVARGVFVGDGVCRVNAVFVQRVARDLS